ncbi:AzlC family ABC transporter permease [Bifidobacterium catulorum]|uniref:AzlC family ABC transporter permease n=1 Tax=Bifidobacterium catulorum TaxID=1630173 RepID=UPI001F4EFC90|nr:AzlC family ABC transporter permease [Bifidobacterium catulorum]
MRVRSASEPGVRSRAFRAAFPLTLPIAAGFLFLGCSYGLLMHAKGFAFLYPVCMAYFIFAGSMEFVTVNLLLGAFNPVAAFMLALMVNARHLFYGLSMLGRYRDMGWKKPYLIFAMCDESFAINSSARIPDDVDRGWFMLFVNLLNRWYWIFGTALGWLVGGLLPVSTKGIEFVLTALFLVIFLDQWMGVPGGLRSHLPAVIGVLASASCLAAFGADGFMIPSMVAMLVLFVVLRPWMDDLKSDGGTDGDVRGVAMKDGVASDADRHDRHDMEVTA